MFEKSSDIFSAAVLADSNKICVRVVAKDDAFFHEWVRRKIQGWCGGRRSRATNFFVCFTYILFFDSSLYNLRFFSREQRKFSFDFRCWAPMPGVSSQAHCRINIRLCSYSKELLELYNRIPALTHTHTLSPDQTEHDVGRRWRGESIVQHTIFAVI